jgi:hypothetical protein
MSYETAVNLVWVLAVASAVLIGWLLILRAERDYYRLEAELRRRLAAGEDPLAIQNALRIHYIERPHSLRSEGGASETLQLQHDARRVSAYADKLIAEGRRMGQVTSHPSS